tara:strand:- start:47 stop:1174 length:1128 start_codon:yes stop_codon:yes gene_type:complete
MAVIQAETYAKFKPIFLDALKTRTEPGADRKEMMHAIISQLKDASYTREDAEDIRPYIELFLEEVHNGTIEPFPKGPFLTGLKPDPDPVFAPFQKDLFTPKPQEKVSAEQALIDQLIAATKLYDSSEAIEALFAFTINLREFAPFNAMLLHIQKPGLTHAATAHDWWQRFGRVPKKGMRPMLVLRTKGPVDFVFDILDTEGREVPVDAFAFPTFGDLTDNRFGELMRSVAKERIDLIPLDSGDGQAGWIRLLAESKAKTGKNVYQLAYNRNHPAPTRFVTVAHELAHLYLGHLGSDAGRRVPNRRDTPHALMEVEAEMVAYLVAMRNGLKPRSESYLANYKGAFEDLNLYAVTRAANAVETAMGIASHKLWNEKS